MAKELLKLQKKLRGIESIERKLQGGEMVDELRKSTHSSKRSVRLLHTCGHSRMHYLPRWPVYARAD